MMKPTKITRRGSVDEEQSTSGQKAETLSEGNTSEDKSQATQSTSNEDGESATGQVKNRELPTGEYHGAGLKLTLHGYIYQVKLLILFLKRGIDQKYSFSLATEMVTAEKFDDVVFMYEEKDSDKIVCRFLQAKHVQNGEKIGVIDLLTEADDKFSLQKYFISYRKIKQNPEFKSFELKDFVICTNTHLKEGLRGSFDQIVDKDEILNFDDYFVKADRLKLKLDKFPRKNHLVEILKRTSDLHRLAKSLALCVKNNQQLHFSDSLFKSYHGFLVEHVIERTEKNTKNHVDSEEACVKFRESFTKGPGSDKFRTIFFEECVKIGMAQNEVWENIEKTKLKVSKDFTKVLKVGTDFTLSDVKAFAVEIANAIEAAKKDVVHIETKKDIIKNNIDKLAGYVLISKENNIKYVYFSDAFFDDYELPGNLNEFRIELNEELEKKGVEFNRDKYKFHVNNFQTCIESNPSSPNDNIPDKDIEDFFDKLVFAVNQPNETDLDLIIGAEMGKHKDIYLIDTEFMESLLQKYILDWAKERKGFFLTHKDGEDLFKKMKQQISNLVAIGSTQDRRAKIEALGIQFSIVSETLEEFLSPSNRCTCTRIFNFVRSFENSTSSSIKVLQTLEKLGYEKENSYIFIRLDSLLLERVQKRVMNAFESKTTNHLLVIECKAKKENVQQIRQLYLKLCRVMNNAVEKKILLVTQKGNDLAEKFKPDFSVNGRYQEVMDEKNSLYDLTDASQNKLLDLTDESGKGRVIFQGKETILRTLVDDKSKHLFKGEILCKLINNQQIEVGKAPIDVKYDNVKDYFVERKFNRRVIKIAENFQNERSQFFVIDNKQIIEQIPQSESQNKLLDLTDESGKERVIFQRKETISRTLLDDKSKHDYSVKRKYIRRVMKIAKNFQNEKSQFFVTDNKQIIEQIPQSDIVLISDTGEDFKKLCDNPGYKKHSIHWLQKVQNEFIWRKSQGSLSKLRNFAVAGEQNIENSEPKNIMDLDDRIVIIADKPGMGKSVLLSHLAAKTEPDFSRLWIVRCNLLDYSTEFKDWKERGTAITIMEAVIFLYKAMNFRLFEKKEQMLNERLSIHENDRVVFKSGNEEEVEGSSLLEVELFTHFYNQGKIALLFDGFDEISPHYKNKVLELVGVLKDTNVEKLWMTTRPYNIQHEAENKLGTFSYELAPFCEADQECFLKKFWRYKLKVDELNEQRAKVFIDKLLRKFSKSANDENKEFGSIPLQIYMIADVFFDEFRKFYLPDNNELPEENEQSLDERLNLATLYETFLRRKFDELLKKENSNFERDKCKPWTSDIVINECEMYLVMHEKLAFYVMLKIPNSRVENAHEMFSDELFDIHAELFSEQDMKVVREWISKIEHAEEKTGIIISITDDVPDFIHRTFAEYLAASYIWKKFKSIQSCEFHLIFSSVIDILNRRSGRQISYFLQVIANKDLGKIISFPDKIYKLEILLLLLIGRMYNYEYRKDEFEETELEDESEETEDSIKLILGIFEFFSSIEGSALNSMIDKIEETRKRFQLLCESAAAGYEKLSIVLKEKVTTAFLRQQLERNSWELSPFWLAAEKSHIHIAQIFIDTYNNTLRDSRGMNLINCIFLNARHSYTILECCLKLGILDTKPYYDHGNQQLLPLVEAVSYYVPSNMVELLMEQTDFHVVKKWQDSVVSAAAYPGKISMFIWYDEEIIQCAIKKGVDFSCVINLLIFEFTYRCIKNVVNKYLLPVDGPYDSAHLKKMECMFEDIERLLQIGIGYNCKDKFVLCKESTKNVCGGEFECELMTLQYAKQIHYFQKLLDSIIKLHSCENYGSRNPIDTILRIIIDSMNNSPNFEGYEIITKNMPYQQLFLLAKYKRNSTSWKNIEIPLLPFGMVELLLKSYEDNNTDLVKNAVTELHSFFSHLPNGMKLDPIYMYLTSENIYDIKEYKNLDSFSKCLVNCVTSLYEVGQWEYECDTALTEVSVEANQFKSVVDKLLEMNENSGGTKKVYTYDEILHIFDIGSIDINDELKELVLKNYEFGGMQLLYELWPNLQNNGQKRIKNKMKEIIKFSDQITKVFDLLNELDSLYNKLTAAIENKNYQEIDNILQEKPNYKKAIINGQDDQFGSPLHYAACKGEVKTIRILLNLGADLDLKLKQHGELLSSTKNLTEEMKEDKDYTSWTPLHLAALNGHLKSVQLLLQKGAHYNFQNKEQQTPLNLAEYGSDVEKLLRCIDQLFQAVRDNERDVVESLLGGKDTDTFGALMNARDNYDKTVLLAAEAAGQTDVVELFEEKMKFVESLNQQQETVQ